MKLSFDNWVISKDTALLGYQYDNESQELWVTGDLPQGWTWDALIQDGSHYDVWPLTLADRGAYITLNDENLAVPGSFYIQIRGTKGEQVQHTNIVSVYISRSLVGPGTWPTLPTEFSQAEKAIKELNAHPPIPGENGFWLLWNLETSSYGESQLPVPVGPAGPANVLEMGEVTTLAPEEAATAELTGESPHQVLHLGLPQGKTGEPGPTGPTPQLTVGKVTTLDPEEPATAELSGTPEKPVLNLGIPQGKTGQPGPTGDPGPANILQVGQVTTLAPDQPATAEITGASPTQTLNLGLPQGKTGSTGAAPELTMGEVTTLDPGEPATAELSGAPEAPVLSLGIPQGQPGKDGVQLEDDAVTSTAAWSSRKIVDALCPAFTAEGNPVTCQPVEGYPLDVKVNFGPIQAGEGDPSPENVRPISGRDSLTLTRCGKNLLDVEILKNENAWNQTKSYWSYELKIPDNAQYTLSVQKNNMYKDYKSEYNGNFAFYVGNVPGTASPNTKFGNSGSDKSTILKSYTFTKTIEPIYFNLYVLPAFAEEFSSIVFDELLPGIQLELSSTPTSYEPYQGDTYDITLPETVYGGTVDVVTDKGEKIWEGIVLTGQEDWMLYADQFIITSAVSSSVVTYVGICSHYSYGYSPSKVWINQNRALFFGADITASFDKNLETFKSYLAAKYAAGTPVTIAYQLATPEAFEGTPQPIPALPGTNTLYTDGDRVTIAGKQDLTYTLRQIQEQLAAESGVTEALTGTD